ncbi:unnamed protein product [Arabis nemorensis]|uniref:Myb-like domain-containing protein n=1 Tax=Arabis nemorensis TaxID=586526 RepID=A0A565C3U0_9BRAS|nr:unnamed protein product [Arabis nemorensis]
MELLAGASRKRAGDDFAGDVNPFDGSDGGCEWMYGSRQSGSLRHQGNDDALATLADLAPPPQKLKPIRSVVKPPSSEDRHPLDILAGTLERFPEIGFGCFEAPLGTKIADVEEGGQLTRGFTKEDSLGDEMEFQNRISGNRTSWDGVSLSSSVDSDSDSDSSPGARKKAVTGKRKRETRDKLEHFLGKLVGSMMKRQEKMHNQLIKVMEKMEHERVGREEAWRQQEMERMRQNEEARKEEMSRSLSLISFIKTVIGDEIEIEIPKPLSDPLPQPHQHLPEKFEERNFESAETQRDRKLVNSSGKRWPQEEVQALITSRSEVEEKTGIHKFSIWDEISAMMKEKGYDRSAKKCKEKWENMNKYYRRVMEGKKKQPERSKTRSYFQKLSNLYNTNSGSADHAAEKEEE